MVITFDNTVDGKSTIVNNDFEVSVAGNGVCAQSSAINAGKIELTLATAVTHGQTVNFKFTDTTSDINDGNGNELADFGPTGATNNVLPIVTAATVSMLP